jgi:hypothetical protein
MPQEVLEKETHLASRPFANPDEEIVAAILDELNIRWQYETVRVVEHDGEGNVIAEAILDFYLPDLQVLFEVKHARIRSTHQSELALRAGYGFAYIKRKRYPRPVLRRRVKRAIQRALVSGQTAKRRVRRLREPRTKVFFNIQVQLFRN